MVAERPVPKVRSYRFRGVEPGMYRHEIVDRAAPFLHRRQGVVIRVCHRRPSEIMGVEFGRGETLVELEVDAAGRGVEAELAPGAVVVLPAAMGVGKEVVGQLLDDIRESIDGGYFNEFRDETLAKFYENGSKG